MSANPTTNTTGQSHGTDPAGHIHGSETHNKNHTTLSNNTAPNPALGSDDPSTRDDATATQKLAGDVKGAIHGTIGSMQGAVGATIRNKGMEDAGLQKMEQEDERLAEKKGKPPVGSSRRD